MKKYSNIKTDTGRRLYTLLPDVYRTMDTEGNNNSGDLAKFLDACGYLLDLIRSTLDQRVADAFPDNPEDGPACQPWLLPYFADLLDVRMVSPDESGRRDEVANAVAWRQRKGTLRVLEQITEKVGRFEAEIQEGWKRTAVTPDVEQPLLPAAALGESDKHDIYLSHPAWAARHPGLPAVTVDLRYPSRAVRLEADENLTPQNPAAKLTVFSGEPVWWRQVNRHGVPCFPGSYEDVSRRTADIRTPDWSKGHSHPKRVLLHAPPPTGFFGPDIRTTLTDMTCTENEKHIIKDHNISGTLTVTGGSLTLKRCNVKNLVITVMSRDEFVLNAEDCLFDKVSIGNGAAHFKGCTVLGPAALYSLDASDSIFSDSITVTDNLSVSYSRIPLSLVPGSSTCTDDDPVFFSSNFDDPGGGVLRPDSPLSILEGAEDSGELGAYHNGRSDRPVRIPVSGELTVNLHESSGYVLKDIIFEGTGTLKITSGVLRLERVAASCLEVDTVSETDSAGKYKPVLTARDTLFDRVTVTDGLARFEYCTVLSHCSCYSLEASDCIFVSGLDLTTGTETNPHCIRFSRIPPGLSAPYIRTMNNVTDTPVFYEFEFDEGDHTVRRISVFGESGCAVLHPAASELIRFGSEDGGEMGAYHRMRYCLLLSSVKDKLDDFLPVGMEAVIIPDLRLHRLPFKPCIT